MAEKGESSSTPSAAANQKPAESSSSTTKSKFPFQRAQRSDVWEFFERRSKLEVNCVQCGKALRYLGSTTSLREHLKRFHPSLLAKFDHKGKANIESSFPAAPPSFSPFAGRNCSPATAERITGLLVEWITEDMRPLNIVNDDGFQRLIAYLVPNYTVPSRTLISQIIKRRHEDGKKKLGKTVAWEATACSLTADAWSSRATQSYYTVTCHFITKEWKLCSAVLNTSRFPGSHTGLKVAEKTRQSVMSVSLPEKKNLSIVHDEAANAMAAGRALNTQVGWESVTCAAHLLQTSLRHALDNNQSICRLLAACRRVVTHFRHSNQNTELLVYKERQMGMNPLKLVQEVPTRWNSTFYMLQRILHIRLPLTAVLTSSHQKKEVQALLLRDKQWGLAHKVVEVLKPFEVATSVLSGQQYVTASLVLPFICNLVRSLLAPMANATSSVSSFRLDLASELKGKFHLKDQNARSLLVLAAAMDPRFRGLGFLSYSSCTCEEVKQTVLSGIMELISNDREAISDSVNEPNPKRVKGSEQELNLLFGDLPSEPCLFSLVEEEVQLYFSERSTPNDTDPLSWWGKNEERYPKVALFAKKVLCTPATAVPAEQVFSACGNIVSKLRSSLSPSMVDAMIFLGRNSKLLAKDQPPLPNVPSAARNHSDSSDEEEPALPHLDATLTDDDTDSDE